jgi:hypothetical protein
MIALNVLFKPNLIACVNAHERRHTVPAMRPKIGALEKNRDNFMVKSPFVHQIFYRTNQPTHFEPRRSRVELCRGEEELSKKGGIPLVFHFI